MKRTSFGKLALRTQTLTQLSKAVGGATARCGGGSNYTCAGCESISGCHGCSNDSCDYCSFCGSNICQTAGGCNESIWPCQL